MNGPSLGWLETAAGLLPDNDLSDPSDRALLAPPGAAPPQPQNAPRTMADVGTPDPIQTITPKKEEPPKKDDFHYVSPYKIAERADAAAAQANAAASTATTAADVAQQDAVKASPPPAAAAEGPAGPPSPPPPADVQFAPVGGRGFTPAHEAFLRGPQQQGHLDAALVAPAEAAARADMRNQQQVMREDEAYAKQAEDALNRQATADAVLARRQSELQQMQRDYQDSVAKLGTMHLDSNRWWANKSTPDKIGSIALAFIGGIAMVGNGGHNPMVERATRAIDDDINAQKFDYQMGLEKAKSAQNAYGQLLERYGSEDAATAAARAAGLDFAIAKTNQLKAQWGGTNSANAADDFIAKLTEEREKTLANGFRFIPAAVAAQRYAVSVRGQTLPGTVSEGEAQRIALEHGVKPAERVDEELVKGGVQATLAQQKLAAEQQAKGQENGVVLPSGETVYPKSAATADKIRAASVSMQKTQRLVREAKEIRDSSAFRASPSARARLGQIQAELLTDFGVQHQLGALSDKDYEIAQQGTASLFDIGSPVEARLDRLHQSAAANLRELVNTVPGAKEGAPRATGTMPKSTKYHGGE